MRDTTGIEIGLNREFMDLLVGKDNVCLFD